VWLYFGASIEEARLVELSLHAQGRRIRVAVPGSVGAAFDLIWGQQKVKLLLAYVCAETDRLSDVHQFLLFEQGVNTFPVVALCSGQNALETAQRMGFNHCIKRGSSSEDLQAVVQRLLAFTESNQWPAKPSLASASDVNEVNSVRCTGFNRNGSRCGRLSLPGTQFCWQHRIDSTENLKSMRAG
jgi:hypothetical protein